MSSTGYSFRLNDMEDADLRELLDAEVGNRRSQLIRNLLRKGAGLRQVYTSSARGSKGHSTRTAVSLSDVVYADIDGDDVYTS